MLIDTLRFLVKTLTDLFILVLLLRFYLQIAGASVRHPLVVFIKRVTDFAVLPTRKLLRPWRGYDTASLGLAWLTALLTVVVMLLLSPLPYGLGSPQNWLVMVFLAVLAVFRASVYLLMGALIVQAIMSWVNPYNPVTPLLELLTRPFLRPFRRLVVANVDLSPLVLLILLQVVLMLPLALVEQLLLGQLRFGM